MNGVLEIAAHVHARSGLSLGPEKLDLLEARLAPIMRDQRLPDLGALAGRLRGSGSGPLSKAVVAALTTSESLFFRDGTPFEHVRDRALPALHRARPPGQPLRIWSAAASCGQEAYSLAMVASEVPGLLAERAVKILGTDIAAAPLEQARSGIYSRSEVQRGLSGAQLARWFMRHGDRWRIDGALRAMVAFRSGTCSRRWRRSGRSTSCSAATC